MGLLDITYSIDKDSNSVNREGLAGRPKIEILFLNKEYIITKEGGYSDWVDRCTGKSYSPSKYRFAKVLNIKNYKNTIYIDTKEIECIDVKNNNKNKMAKEWTIRNVEETKPIYSKTKQKEIDFIKKYSNNLRLD